MNRFVLGAVAAATAGAAHAAVFDFEGFEHGRIINTQLAPALTVSANNFNKSFDLAITFDSNRTADPNDPDLLFPWDRGNLAPTTRLGNLLILAENNRGAADGVLDDPDDEAGTPAGEFTFTFANAVSVFGFDIVDVENATSENGRIQLFQGNSLVVEMAFSELVNPSSAYYDPSVVLGDNSANRIRPFSATTLGAAGFTRAVIRLGGSGAVDNLVVPAPAAATLFGLALVGAGRRRR
ncbi:MAG: hypothetical protein SFZ23_04290 [Planctomycetota bacterium]|nr:hypothetical protein [Planctomycetota bacterium]